MASTGDDPIRARREAVERELRERDGNRGDDLVDAVGEEQRRRRETADADADEDEDEAKDT
jgi:hypothetical protein